MSWISFGVVTVTNAGTPVQVTTSRTPAHAILIETLWTNTGRMYVGRSTLNVSTKVGLLNVLPAPTSATTGPFPAVSAGIPSAPNGLLLNEIWLDAQNSGEGVLISYLQN